MESLARLASKPGVQSTLILSRLDGAIIRSTGLLAGNSANESSTTETKRLTTSNGPSETKRNDLENTHGDGEYGRGSLGTPRTVEDVAKMVFTFVSATGALIEGLNDGDEVKLLRLRTEKNEIVIVPGWWITKGLSLSEDLTADDIISSADSKFLLVVIHDAPTAT